MATTAHRTIDVNPLRRAHRGPVLTSADEGWDAARTPWNVAVRQRPEVVARAECTEDVVAAVRFARDSGLRVRVQGTGHGACGDLEGTLLIDTSALRGGGGNFGAVTALEFRLHPIAEVFAGNLFWPIDHAREVLLAYAAWTETTPDTVTSSIRLLRLPPIPVVPEPLRRRSFINVVAGVIGDPEAGAAAVAPLRAIAPPYLDTLASMPAAGLSEVAGDPLDPVPTISGHALLEGLPPEAIDALLAVAGPETQTPLLQVEMRQLGGSLSAAPAGSGAVGGLEAGFALFAVGLPMEPGHAEAIAASLAGIRKAVGPWTTERRYLNFTDDAVDAATLYAPPAHRRLAELRARLDPRGLFHPNHAIEPAR